MSELHRDPEPNIDADPHFDPVTYADEIRVDVPAYDELQSSVANAAAESISSAASLSRVLDLGAGTGETSRALLARCPGAVVTLFDESAEMLAAATARLPKASVASVVVADLLDLLPTGPFDVVISCLAIHHLDGAGKRALFERVRAVLAPGARFVMGDVIVPEDPADAIAPLEEGYDVPSRLPELVAWLGAAGFDANVVWLQRDLAVVTADVADSVEGPR